MNLQMGSIQIANFGYVVFIKSENGITDIAIGKDIEEVQIKYLNSIITNPKLSLSSIDVDDPIYEELKNYFESGKPCYQKVDYSHGTPFQRAVWKHLETIPTGTVQSYQEVANAIGCGPAVRAVAKAVASNRIAGLVPCHRVIYSNGNLSGYRWGNDYKIHLLKKEQYLK